MLILCDIDGVVADLMTTWLARYNADYNYLLSESDITEWNLQKFVVPECGDKIFAYLHDPDLYDSVPVVPGALEGIKALRELGDVVFVTKEVDGDNLGRRKLKWLRQNGFLPNDSTALKFYVEWGEKYLIRASMLIDDSTDNLVGFDGIRVIYDRPHNQDCISHDLRLKNWGEIDRLLLTLPVFRSYYRKGHFLDAK